MIDWTMWLGLPWKDGGRSRDGVDCWGLVRLFYMDEMGVELPILSGAQGDQAPVGRWGVVCDPKPGDVAVYRRGGGLHCGVVAPSRHVLHVERNVCSRLSPHGSILLAAPVDYYRASE